MKKYIKDHKILVVAIFFMVLLLALVLFVINVFFYNNSNASYGNRLDGIEDVKVSKEDKEKIINTVEEDAAVKSCKYSLQGKIIDAVITINDDVGVDTAKGIAGKVLEALDKDQKNFYDVQVFIKKDNDASDFPIIGYKQNTKDGFSWTKDRAAS